MSDRLRTAGPGPWFPRWVVDRSVDPALRHVVVPGDTIIATTLMGHLALFFGQNESVYTVDLRDGSVSRTEVAAGADAFYPDACFGTVSGRTVVAAVTYEQVFVWDATTGAPLIATDDVPRRAGELVSVRIGRVGDIDMVFAGTRGGYLLGWRMPDGERVAKLSGGHHGDGIYRFALSADGPPTAATADQGALCFWDLAGGRLIGEPHLVTVGLADLAWTVLDGQRRVVTVDENGTLAVWHPHRPDPLASHASGIYASRIACAEVDGRPVALVGGRQLHYIDLVSGRPVGRTATDFEFGIAAVAVSPAEGPDRPVVVVQTACGLDRINVFDLVADPPATTVDGRTDARPGSVLTRFTNAAPLTLDDRPLIATIATDSRIRLYDATTGAQVGDPLDAGTSLGYRPLWCTTIGGRPVGVTTANTAIAALHLDDGSLALPKLGLTGAALRAVAYHESGDDQFVATTDGNGVLVHHLGTARRIGRHRGALGRHRGRVPSVSRLAMAEVAAHLVVLAAGPAGVLHRLNAHGMSPWAPPIPVHPCDVAFLETVTVDGEPIAVSVGEDGVVSSRNIGTGERHGPDLRQDGAVRAATTALVDGAAAAITATDDRVVRIWDLASGRCTDSFTAPGRVRRILRLADGGLILLDGTGIVRLDA